MVVGARSLGFSPMGAGIGAMPIDRCAQVMVSTVRESAGSVPGSAPETIVFAAVKAREIAAFRRCLE
ncbi:MAG: hypothetical protein HY319_26045 [Armatimonadetes bacterium]|nr:hypothetical protein [Armatimonadota bacterium]